MCFAFFHYTDNLYIVVSISLYGTTRKLDLMLKIEIGTRWGGNKLSPSPLRNRFTPVGSGYDSRYSAALASNRPEGTEVWFTKTWLLMACFDWLGDSHRIQQYALGMLWEQGKEQLLSACCITAWSRMLDWCIILSGIRPSWGVHYKQGPSRGKNMRRSVSSCRWCFS